MRAVLRVLCGVRERPGDVGKRGLHADDVDNVMDGVVAHVLLSFSNGNRPLRYQRPKHGHLFVFSLLLCADLLFKLLTLGQLRLVAPLGLPGLPTSACDTATH